MAAIGPKQLPLFTVDVDGPGKDDDTVIHELDASSFGHHVLDFTDIVSCALPSFSYANDFLASDPDTPKHDAPDVPTKTSSSKASDRRPLEFSAPVFNVEVLDEAGQLSDLSRMAAQFQGMFFIAEDAFESDNSGRPSELTCYRRNLWECVGELTLSRGVSHTRDKKGNTGRIHELAVSLAAIDAASGRATEVVTMPWRSKGSGPGDESKMGITPEPYPLNLNRLQQINTQKVTFKFAWKRLQFKHATANNGRRNGLQQYYVIRVNLIAKIETGEWIDISQMTSSPLVVRGRNPKNFGSKDIPLFSEEILQQKNVGGVLSRQRTELRRSVETNASSISRNSVDADQRAVGELGSSTNKPIKLSLEPSNPGGSIKQAQSKCISLELFEGSDGGDMSVMEERQKRNKRLKSPKSTVNSARQLGSPLLEEKDRLYEYFPINLDDWLPPVETVYLPHMDHLKGLMTDMHRKEIPRKLKRYFIADSVV